MVITKIEKQKKNKERYNISIDGEFAFGLYEDSLVKYGLRSGDELTAEKIKEMKEYDEFGYGKKVAYSFLAYKQRSKKELVKKLKLKKISDASIVKITELLEKQKYLNDELYAENFIEDKLNSRPIGKRLAKLKLSEKGIDKEMIEETLNKIYTNDKETEYAVIVLEKYAKKVKYKDEADKKNKCYRYLISKGFDFDTVKKVLSIEY
ncbi:MAG TPA: RecX family transcriptional regulator [Ignavibacteria bacterium]|nr:RecX family transcriptional regulator [Ignavibacteria bacterium]HMR40798.1 RecX family transcriptional regulator [Ignavibacteria bacterium]